MNASAPARPAFPLVALRAMRLRQWPKNGLLLAPLIFSRSALTQDKPLRAVVAMAAFSLLASGVYVVNDWVDREKDRAHPEKRQRPIAAGHLGAGGAVALVALCWAVAAALGAWVNVGFLGVLGGYLLLQVAYTFSLKHLVVLDIMAIALGFIVRVVAGAVAIDVEVSNWLFLCTLFGALFLGFAKRRAELNTLEEGATSHRKNLADYSLPMLDQMMSVSAACSILSYSLYTVSRETAEHVGSDRLKFTVPFVVYGIFRYQFLVHRHNAGGAPEKVLLSDRPLQLTIAGILAVAAVVLYV